MNAKGLDQRLREVKVIDGTDGDEAETMTIDMSF